MAGYALIPHSKYSDTSSTKIKHPEHPRVNVYAPFYGVLLKIQKGKKGDFADEVVFKNKSVCTFP
jgi:hypothetical protein